MVLAGYAHVFFFFFLLESFSISIALINGIFFKKFSYSGLFSLFLINIFPSFFRRSRG